MISERLHGLDGSPPVYPGPADGKRGIFSIAPGGTGFNTGATGANTFTAACKAIPAATASANSDHRGNNAFASYTWHPGMVDDNHLGTPKSLSCTNTSADASWLTHVGPFSSTPAPSNHPGGVSLALADGSVRFVKDSVTLPVRWGPGDPQRSRGHL